MINEELEMPVDVKSCLNLYLFLLEKIEEFSWLTTLSYEYLAVCCCCFFNLTEDILVLISEAVLDFRNYEIIIINIIIVVIAIIII